MDVSVIMPVYNGALYISESIRTVLSQTLTNFEFIIVNDGSTDNTMKIIRHFDDPRIKIFNLNHNFIASSNRGLEEAKGKYIARIDADDLMRPERLQCQYDFMENNPHIDICCGWAECFGERHST